MMVRPLRPAPVALSSGDPQKYFRVKCATCHGEFGKGDGPRAALLGIKPRAFVDAAWQSTVANDWLARAITEGGSSVGKSQSMPAHVELKDEPELLEELVGFIREFGDRPSE